MVINVTSKEDEKEQAIDNTARCEIEIGSILL